MHISKTTHNFAEKRNLEVYVNEDFDLITVTHDAANNDSADVEFDILEDGTLEQSQCFNSKLGNTCVGIIKTASDFRKVIDAISKNR